jgi:hypothetical protein
VWKSRLQRHLYMRPLSLRWNLSFSAVSLKSITNEPNPKPDKYHHTLTPYFFKGRPPNEETVTFLILGHVNSKWRDTKFLLLFELETKTRVRFWKRVRFSLPSIVHTWDCNRPSLLFNRHQELIPRRLMAGVWNWTCSMTVPRVSIIGVTPPFPTAFMV